MIRRIPYLDKLKSDHSLTTLITPVTQYLFVSAQVDKISTKLEVSKTSIRQFRSVLLLE